MTEDGPPIRYVIAVHGIGEQRKYETVLPVINRFAEIRSGRSIGDPLTLGSLASHFATEQWIEYDQVPCAASQAGQPFVGRHVRTEGRNIRFVDMHWADVMQRQFDDYGQNTATWTRSLINRLESRAAPDWIIELLRTLRAGVVPLQQLLGMRLPGLSDKIFNRFLGDVQLYGEYVETRAEGVHRFHSEMAKLHRLHTEDSRSPGDPAYSIIAHSLGSMMAFDALLFAHGARQYRALDLKVCPIGSGYQGSAHEEWTDEHRLPRMDWVKHVDSFVTLGSPIDKFLILWWLNYQHLADTAWMDNDLLEYRARNPIRHYNYCDEQDPVGHELDLAYTSEAVNRILERCEDVVFTRYVLPGVAHVKYWRDRHLFWRILNLIVDGKLTEAPDPPNGQTPRGEAPRLAFTYRGLLGGRSAILTILGRCQRALEQKRKLLLHWFRRRFIDGKPEEAPDPPNGQTPEGETPDTAHPVQWFRPLAYVAALFWSYLAIPLVGWITSTLLLTWAVNLAEGWSSRIPVAAASFLVVVMSCWLMVLLIKWHRAMLLKRQQSASLPRRQTRQRDWADGIFWVLVLVLPLLLEYGLLAALVPLGVEVSDPLGFKLSAWFEALPDRLREAHLLPSVPEELTDSIDRRIHIAIAVALSYGLILALWNAFMLLRTSHKWDRMDVLMNFAEYLDRDPSRPLKYRA